MPGPKQLVGGTLCLDFINSRDDLDDASREPENRARVRLFRDALRRILVAEARGTGAPEKDLASINRILAAAGARRGLVSTVRGYGWGWLDERAGAERALWPVAFSAARLLEGGQLSRLKECGGCGTLFIDASKNRSRRWCDMQGCGNRAKVARYRARKD